MAGRWQTSEKVSQCAVSCPMRDQMRIAILVVLSVRTSADIGVGNKNRVDRQ